MKTLRTAALSCAALALLYSVHAAAQQRLYKCVDDKGKVYYTQVPPKECLGRETQELSRQGQVVKRNEAMLSTEQQAARDAERKKQQEQQIAEREEQRKNQALLNTYSSVNDIEDARARSLKDNEKAIQDAQNRMATAEKRKKELEAEKEFYLKKPMPLKLRDDIKNNELEINTQRGLLDVVKKQASGINAKYDEDRRRYAELTKAQPAAASSQPAAAKK